MEENTGEKELSELRNELRDIDSELLKLFEKRLDLVKKAWKTKRQLGKPMRDRALEEKIIAGLIEDTSLCGSYVRRIFDVIFELNEEEAGNNK